MALALLLDLLFGYPFSLEIYFSGPMILLHFTVFPGIFEFEFGVSVFIEMVLDMEEFFSLS